MFIPGYLILRCLELKNINNTLSFLLSVGISLSYCIICGYLLNTFGPLFSINNPMSVTNVLAVILSLSIILSIFCYLKEKGKNYPLIYIEIGDRIVLKIILISILPFLTILGTYLMNNYEINILLIIVLILIGIIPLLISLNILPIEILGLTIFISSISLIYHTSLISDFLWGWDIHYEYYISNNVLSNQFWNSTETYGLNSLLLIAALAPTYSLLTGIDLVWIYKIVFPFFFSLVPLALYYLFRYIFKNEYLAALSPFCFMFYYGFFKTMPDKQLVSEFFFILILIIILTSQLHKIKWKLLLLIFSFSLIVSHYGISWLFLFMIIFTLLFIKFDETLIYKSKEFISDSKLNKNLYIYSLLFAIALITWYYFTSTGSNFNTFVNLGASVGANIKDTMIDSSTRTGIGYASIQATSFMWNIYKFLFFILTGLISLGIVVTLINQIILKKRLFSSEFLYMAFYFYCFLFVSIFLTLGLGMDRAIQISLLLLSPFVIIGLDIFVKQIFVKQMEKMAKVKNKLVLDNTIRISRISCIGISFFLLTFLLFNSGVVFELTKDPYPPLFAINQSTDFPVFSEAEHIGASWLFAKKDLGKIYADNIDGLLLSENIWKNDIWFFSHLTEYLDEGGYIFLGKHATDRKVLFGGTIIGFNYEHIQIFNSTFYNKVLQNKNSVYYNGNVEIFIT